MEIRAALVRLSHYLVVFEIYNPALVLQMSEVLGGFKVIINERTIYAGRAIVSNVVNTGTVILCEAKLEEGSFTVAAFPPEAANGLHNRFDQFLGQWQKFYRVRQEFKMVIADMQIFCRTCGFGWNKSSWGSAPRHRLTDCDSSGRPRMHSPDR